MHPGTAKRDQVAQPRFVQESSLVASLMLLNCVLYSCALSSSGVSIVTTYLSTPAFVQSIESISRRIVPEAPVPGPALLALNYPIPPGQLRLDTSPQVPLSCLPSPQRACLSCVSVCLAAFHLSVLPLARHLLAGLASPRLTSSHLASLHPLAKPATFAQAAPAPDSSLAINQ